jgi:hypothetical protein
MDEDANSKAVAQVPSQNRLEMWTHGASRDRREYFIFPTVPTQVPAARSAAGWSLIEVSGYDVPNGFHEPWRRDVSDASPENDFKIGS